MRDTVQGNPGQRTGAHEPSIERAIGAQLQALWSKIPQEPLPANLARAVAGLSSRPASPPIPRLPARLPPGRTDR